MGGTTTETVIDPVQGTKVPPHLLALDSVVSRLERSELRRRAADAAQVLLYAEAFDLASPDLHATYVDGVPVSGAAPAELAYRAIRAELACALHLSEHTIERKLAHAHELTTRYSDTFDELRDGALSVAHTEVIITAGHVIGESDSFETICRRHQYEQAVLTYAVRETPARLRPIARRLAEQYAERTIDERFEAAVRERRVWVVDRDDGMSDLCAYLPTVEAHQIYDRLTRASKFLAHAERLHDEQAEPTEQTEQVKLTKQAQAEQATQAGQMMQAGQMRAEQPTQGRTGQPPRAEADINSTPEPTPFVRRTRDQIRTDLFSETLRQTDFEGERLEGEHLDGTLQGVESRTQVQAHIQVIVTDDTLFKNELRIDPETWAKSATATTPDSPDLTESVSSVDITNLAGSPDPLMRLQAEYDAPTSLPPPELAGYGPISTRTARDLAATVTHWDLARIHPVTGAVISVDRYRPSEQMRRLLAVRDEHCRFPGCRAPAHRCDIDHTIDAAKGGPTVTTNLAHLCRGHHTMKHHGGWNVTQTGDGVLHWKSPTGRSHTDTPPSTVRFEQVKPGKKPTAQPGAEPSPY